MAEFLHNNTLVFWCAITLICVVPTLAHYWWKVRRTELDNRLKQEMIAHGMSADEIERVLRAGSKTQYEEAQR
jgi:hypothetical protein